MRIKTVANNCAKGMEHAAKKGVPLTGVQGQRIGGGFTEKTTDMNKLVVKPLADA